MKISLIILSLGLFLIFTTSKDAQAFFPDDDKKTSINKERMEADALAMAYLFCEFSIDIENAKTKPKDKRLSLKSKESQKLYIRIDTTMQKRYASDFDKFKRLFVDGQKKFKVCADLAIKKANRLKMQEAARLKSRQENETEK